MSDHLQTTAAMGFIKSMLVGFNIAFWVSVVLVSSRNYAIQLPFLCSAKKKEKKPSFGSFFCSCRPAEQ